MRSAKTTSFLIIGWTWNVLLWSDNCFGEIKLTVTPLLMLRRATVVLQHQETGIATVNGANHTWLLLEDRMVGQTQPWIFELHGTSLAPGRQLTACLATHALLSVYLPTAHLHPTSTMKCLFGAAWDVNSRLFQSWFQEVVLKKQVRAGLQSLVMSRRASNKVRAGLQSPTMGRITSSLTVRKSYFIAWVFTQFRSI